MRLFHGSKGFAGAFDPIATRGRGVHLGTYEQALMRSVGSGRVLVEVDVRMPRLRRCLDTGGSWGKKIAAAREAGYDGIVYLNRYEGITTASIERAQRHGVLLDEMSDAQFRRWCPESRDSFIVLYAEDIRIVGYHCPAPPPLPLNTAHAPQL